MPRIVRRLAALAVVAFAVVVAGCDTPPTRAFPEITFVNRPPIPLDVARVEVVQAYQPTLEPPQVEHLFPRAPSEVMRRWADDRLQPVGAAGVARLHIEQAGVRSEPLARTPGVLGALKIEQAERLTANFALRLEAEGADGARGYAAAAAERSITVPEDATLAEREAIWFRLTENTMADLDARLEMAIRNNLGPLFRR